MAVMSFFDDVQPGEPEPPREHHPWDPPEAEFPGAVPFSTLILGRTERAAVAVTGLSAYSAGFEIFVTARVRPDGDPDAGPGGGMPPPGRAPGGARRSFRFGLQFADGPRWPAKPSWPPGAAPGRPAWRDQAGDTAAPILFTTSTTPSMSQVRRTATGIRSLWPPRSGSPVSVTMPLCTRTVTGTGSVSRI